MKTNIVLYGFALTGKTRVGRRLAQLHGLEFVDTDEMIVDLEGAPIDEVLAARGEVTFRGLERDIVREVAGRERSVIACGSLVPLDPGNARMLSVNGVGILLTARASTILERARAGGHGLLGGSLDVAKIQALLGERKRAYDRIPHRVDTHGLSVEQVAERVFELFKESQEASGVRTVRI